MTSGLINLGQFEIHGLRDGFFYLDGGAMFGVVPKSLWERKCTPDRQNRIKLGLNSILIKTDKKLVLVETGIGARLNPKFSEYYAVERKPDLIASLGRLGIEAGDIDVVINTHLHFDHCHGNTEESEKGEIVPAFPQAKYIIQRGEWEYALNPCFRDKPSYISDSFLPLEKQGLVQFVDGDTEISEGIEAVLAPGHTAYHQCVKVQSDHQTFFFLADMVPTSAHVGLPYIMSYDLFPLETLENKKKFFDQAIEEDWIVGFVHDPNLFFGKIDKVEDKYTFASLG